MSNTYLEANGHEAAFLANPFASVYSYDRADDGPECEVITRISAKHPHYFEFMNGTEKRALEYSRYLDAASLVLLEKHFADLGYYDQNAVRQIVARKVSAMEGLGLL
jgi:hypothetical protein